MSSEELTNKLKEVPLPKRLNRCAEIIGLMCLAGRPPRMSIPVQWDDEDFFIVETVREAAKEVERINRRIVTCVYCGMEYPSGTPAWGHPILTEHIKICPEHPLRKVEVNNAVLRSALIGLVGVKEKKDLQAMSIHLLSLPIPEEERAPLLNAIAALLLTMPEEKTEG